MVTKIIVFLFFFFQGAAGFAQSEALRNIETLILKDAYSEAARECAKILDGSSGAKIKSQAHYLLGICLLQEAKYEAARNSFNKILDHYSRSQFCDDAILGIADSYLLAEDFQQAGKKYEQFLEDFPQSELAAIARVRLEQCKQGRHLSDSYFSVQVGCFAQEANAENLHAELIDRGFQAYILKLAAEDLYRVRIGRFSNRLEAEFLQQQLQAQGYPTKICP